MPQDRRTRLPGWLGGALVVGACAAAFYLEHQRPLRRETESKLRRDLRNLSVAALSAATLQVLEKPVVEPLARLVERRRWGIVPQLGLPRPVEDAVAILLMDYTLYIWHVWTHRIPFLWRFHLVHHADLDCSATTAVRFHFGEMALSVPYRAAQVLVIGTSPRALHLWQRLVLVSITFHHSNLRLPKTVDSALAGVIVTPRMHGIHHSADMKEADSNWSSGLTIWDRLHGTLRLDVPQEDLTIGVEGYETSDDVAFARLMGLPFQDQRSTKRSLPSTGVSASKEAVATSQDIGLIREAGTPTAPRLTVVIPTWNEAPLISDAVRRAALIGDEVIVADGGSIDGTVERAEAAGARVVTSAKGRGIQLHAGAERATGQILLFLHADARLPPHARIRILEAIRAGAIGGGFFIRFLPRSWFTRLLEPANDLRRRLTRGYYGDTGIFVRVDVYHDLGGFQPWAVMHDYEFSRRMERAGPCAYIRDPCVQASARRFQGREISTLRTWLTIQSLYRIGVPPQRLARRYPDVRSNDPEEFLMETSIVLDTDRHVAGVSDMTTRS